MGCSRVMCVPMRLLNPGRAGVRLWSDIEMEKNKPEGVRLSGFVRLPAPSALLPLTQNTGLQTDVYYSMMKTGKKWRRRKYARTSFLGYVRSRIKNADAGGINLYYKIFRYYIQASRTPAYHQLMARADAIYRGHLDYTLHYAPSSDEPGLWIEIQIFPSEQAYRNAAGSLYRDPELDLLYEQFLTLLDPGRSSIQEETYSHDSGREGC